MSSQNSLQGSFCKNLLYIESDCYILKIHRVSEKNNCFHVTEHNITSLSIFYFPTDNVIMLDKIIQHHNVSYIINGKISPELSALAFLQGPCPLPKGVHCAGDR